MVFPLFPHIDGSPDDGGLDPRIDPRLMWPLRYVRDNLGFEVVSSAATALHGDVLRVDLVRGPVRVRVASVPATHQIFLTQGEQLLGVYGSFPELVTALRALTAETRAA